jgi:PEP-CTERM motif
MSQLYACPIYVRQEIIVNRTALLALVCTTAALAAPVHAQATFQFNSGNVDGRMAMASRPERTGIGEIEAADDFILTHHTRITSASFIGIVPLGGLPDVSILNVEIYRVFPGDSRNPPSGNVPTRVNSPGDNAFQTRGSGSSELTYTTTVLNPNFTAANSVINTLRLNGGSSGPATGAEVLFTVNFTSPFELDADHYFFVPQVALGSGEFFWLSSIRPIVPPGTAFSPDLQAWMRNADLDPDWLRVGTDIIGGTPAPTFNGAFTLTGVESDVVPEPASIALFAGGLLTLAVTARRRRIGTS